MLSLARLQIRIKIVDAAGQATTMFHRFLNDFAAAIEGAVDTLAAQLTMIEAAQAAAAQAALDAAAAQAAADSAQTTADDAADIAAGLAGPQYLVAALSAVLTNERVLVGGSGVTVSYAVPAAATITVNVATAQGYVSTSVTGLTGVQSIAAFKIGLAISAADLTNGTSGTGQVILAIGPTLTLPKTTGYTVAGLPAGTIGARAHVTDATAPTFLGALTGGGAVVTPVFHNGSVWVAG